MKFIRLHLVLVFVPFKVAPFHVHATGPALLPLLEAPLELTFGMRYGVIAVVPEFEGRPGDDTLVAEISFPENGRNKKGTNQASE